MSMEVLHNTCNMHIHDLPDMNALIPPACGPWASCIHIRQIPHAHGATTTYFPVKPYIKRILLYNNLVIALAMTTVRC